MTKSPQRDQPVVVGVFYPPAWYGDRDGFTDAVAALTAIDPRVAVIVDRYPLYSRPGSPVLV